MNQLKTRSSPSDYVRSVWRKKLIIILVVKSKVHIEFVAFRFQSIRVPCIRVSNEIMFFGIVDVNPFGSCKFPSDAIVGVEQWSL